MKIKKKTIVCVFGAGDTDGRNARVLIRKLGRGFK